MASFKVTPSELLESSNRCGEIAANFNRLLGESNSFIDQLLTTWEGDRSTNYAEQYQILKPYLYKAAELFNDMAESLATTAHAYEVGDASIIERFSNPS